MTAYRGHAWGPHPKHALLPLVLVLGVVGWVAYKNPEPVQSSTATKVTAMKPVEGGEVAAKGLPIEVRYGVPTGQTVHLWPEHKSVP